LKEWWSSCNTTYGRSVCPRILARQVNQTVWQVNKTARQVNKTTRQVNKTAARLESYR
jgi:hypothetical protein